MTLLTLHHAMYLANKSICLATKASDDYDRASTAVLFEHLWNVAPEVAFQDDPWNISLGGDIPGSWIAKIDAPDQKYLILSSCNSSMVIGYDYRLDDGDVFGVVAPNLPLQILPKLGDTLREIIVTVIRTGDFHGDKLTPSPLGMLYGREPYLKLVSEDQPVNATVDEGQTLRGYADEIDPAMFKEPIQDGYAIEPQNPALTRMLRDIDQLSPDDRAVLVKELMGSIVGFIRPKHTFAENLDKARDDAATERDKEIGDLWRRLREDWKLIQADAGIGQDDLPRDAEGNVADLTLDDSPIDKPYP